MSSAPPLPPPGSTCRLRIDGVDLDGEVLAVDRGWLHLAAAEGELLVNLARISWIRLGSADGAADGEAARPRPAAKEVVGKPGARAPGRPWSDGDLRAAIGEFLDDRADGEIAAVHGRTRHQVTVLRQAWECARGNLPEDRISPVALTWVERIRRAMRPA